MSKEKNYYTVFQTRHGADHKWIFDEETISKELYNNGPVPDEADVAYWPIGGSNSSDAHIHKVDSEKEIYDFLTAPGDGPDAEDPMLSDIAEYYCAVDRDYGSCTDEFVEKFNLSNDDLFSYDDRFEEAKKMIESLKEKGYTDFDYEKPFYGNNSEMRYSELCEIYDSEKAKSEVDEKAMEQPENSMMDAQNCAESFNEEFKVELTYAGECRGGQYPGDKVDEQDGPLLRADLYRRIDDNPAEDFADESCSSILTNIPADIQVEKAQEYADSILEHLERGQEWISNETLLVNAVGIAEENIGIPMTEEQLQHKLYDLYQLDWMMFHGHSLSEMIKGMSEVARESGDEYITVYDGETYTGEAHFEEDAVNRIYAQWEKDSGFKGEIFACFEEFCENEYLDASYMYELINSQPSPLELTDKLENLYDEFMMAREEREMQEEKDRYFPPDIMGEEVFQYISDVLEKEKKVIGDRAEAADRYDAENDYSPRTLEDAIKTFTPVTGADMLEVLKDESKMDNEKQHAPFADAVLDGALKYDTKLHRKEVYNKVKEWMGKPCDKVAKEIEKLQERNRAQGR